MYLVSHPFPRLCVPRSRSGHLYSDDSWSGADCCIDGLSFLSHGLDGHNRMHTLSFYQIRSLEKMASQGKNSTASVVGHQFSSHVFFVGAIHVGTTLVETVLGSWWLSEQYMALSGTSYQDATRHFSVKAGEGSSLCRISISIGLWPCHPAAPPICSSTNHPPPPKQKHERGFPHPDFIGARAPGGLRGRPIVGVPTPRGLRHFQPFVGLQPEPRQPQAGLAPRLLSIRMK